MQACIDSDIRALGVVVDSHSRSKYSWEVRHMMQLLPLSSALGKHSGGSWRICLQRIVIHMYLQT